MRKPESKSERLKREIAGLLRTSGKLQFSAIKAQLREVNKGSISRALQELQAEGLCVRGGEPRDPVFQPSSPAMSKWEIRHSAQEELKQEVAARAFELVFGGESTVAAWGDRVSAELKTKLASLHKTRERTIILDGGTTCHAIATKLRSVEFPNNSYGVWRLLVITNCPPISRTLYEVAGGPEVVLIGGRLSRDTRSISGHLSEACLREWNITADIALIGATGVDLQRGFCAYSESEATTKAMLGSRGIIKAVAMDSTKVQSVAGSSTNAAPNSITFAFAPIKGVDLLVSDRGIWAHTEFCRGLFDQGVSVLAERD